MQEIQNIVLNNYEKNINYFKNNHEDVYSKLEALNILLENGKYTQKYDLEYKDGYFDIVLLKTGELLYKSDSNKLSKQILRNINTKKNQHVFERFKNYTFLDKDVEILKTLPADQTFATTASIIHYYNQHISKESSMKEIHKFIFFGTGLGLHIALLMQKYNFKVSLIIEDDLELFRLSLFTTQYYKLFEQQQVYFSIAQNEEEFLKTFSQFYETAFSLQHYIKFYAFSDIYQKKIEKVQQLLLTRPENSYPHELLLKKNKKVIQQLHLHNNFLDIRKKTDETFFKNKPVIIVGAGPSLEKNIQWLQKHQNSFIIAAALASLKILQTHDIIPDIILQIDEKEVETKILLDRLQDKSILQQKPLIFSASVPQVLLDNCQQENIYFLEDRTHYKIDKSHLESASIGETMYAIILAFNANKIYLLGLDFALAEDGSTHSKEHHNTQNITHIDIKNIDKDKASIDMDTSLISVKGNFKEIVQTTPRLALSIPIFNQKTRELKSIDQTVYNLNDGAYLDHTIACKAHNIHLSTQLNKDQESHQLLKLFKKYSTQELDQEEKRLLNLRVKQIALIKQAIQVFKETPNANVDMFISSYIILLNDILKEKHLELMQILIIYFLSISSYILDFFNTKELKNRKKHIKKLKEEIIIQLKKIIIYYEEDIKKIV